MELISENLLFEWSLFTWFIIILASFLSGLLHGATGMAGGIVMTAILSQVLSIKIVIPVMTIALILSHSSRTYIYWRSTDWKIAQRVLFFGLPTLISGAYIFSLLSPFIITIVFLIFLLLSLPVKYYTRKKNIKTGPKTLSIASVIWGGIAGNVIGPGFFLAPFVLGVGITRQSFVGTMATITLLMNIVKVTVFSSTALMNDSIFMLGLIVGALTIPGNWIGKKLLNKMDDKKHRYIIDFLTILVIINFIYLLFTHF